MMNDHEPEDIKVKSAILNEVAKIDVPIRFNKLRKIICKNVKNTNWTQFQRVIDSMIKQEKIIETCVVDSEERITPMNDMKGSSIQMEIPHGENDHVETQQQQQNEEQSQIVSSTMKVPLAIIYHLTKKGRKKQKNLEVNTKTLFTFTDESLKAVKTHSFNPKERCSFIIKAIKVQDNEEAVTRHIKTAKTLINKMVKSFEEHPEHFCPRKAGGTFKEQEEAKKRKLEARQKHKRKEMRANSNTSTDSTSKRKRQKFY